MSTDSKNQNSDNQDSNSDNQNTKQFYINNSVINKMIQDNDLADIKLFFSIRYYMYIISFISNLTGSLSLSANIIINIVQNMIDFKEKLIIYQIVSLSIFIFSLGLNYFSNNVDTSVKNQQLKLMMKFGVNSINFNDQDAINFDPNLAIQTIQTIKSK